MGNPVQEFTFQADTQTVIDFIMGKKRFRVINIIWDGNADEPIQITLGAAPVETGNWAIIMLVEFQSPQHVVSQKLPSLKVALIRLSQVRPGECQATLELLDDELQDEPEYSDARKWLHGVAQGFAVDIWRGTLDEWVKQQAKGGAGG